MRDWRSGRSSTLSDGASGAPSTPAATSWPSPSPAPFQPTSAYVMPPLAGTPCLRAIRLKPLRVPPTDATACASAAQFAGVTWSETGAW